MSEGEMCAIGCALAWAVSVILFKSASTSIHPSVINFFKNMLGFLLLIPTNFFINDTIYLPTPMDLTLILIISGAIGIGISDLMFLWGLRFIGASRMAIIETFYSPSIIVFSMIYLGESMTALQIVGSVLICLAILTVHQDRKGSNVERSDVLKGSLLGAIGMVSMGFSVVMLKPIFNQTSLLWIIEVRLAAGTATSLIILYVTTKPWLELKNLCANPCFFRVLAASFMGTYVSMILWVAGFKFNDASIAAVLNQTSTIFTVIFAGLFLREKITALKFLATASAFLGVILITWEF